MRESYRRYVRSTIGPLAELAAEELAAKLGLPGLKLDSRHLQGWDASSLARAVGALVSSDMPLADALELVGLD